MTLPAMPKLLLLPLLAVLAVGLTGCPVVAYLVNAFAPPETIPPKFEIEKGKVILVFVDDFQKPVSYEPIKESLTNKLNALLVDHDVAADVISYDDLEDLIHTRRDFNRLSIPDIGRELKADVVLYVSITRFSLKENDLSPLWQGKMEVMVKVCDATKGILWPKDRADGYPVAAADTRPSESLSETYGIQVAESLATRMAKTIALQFYEHEKTRGIFEDTRVIDKKPEKKEPQKNAGS